MNPITLERKAAADTNRDGLDFFSTTTRPQQRNTINEFLHDDSELVHR